MIARQPFDPESISEIRERLHRAFRRVFYYAHVVDDTFGLERPQKYPDDHVFDFENGIRLLICVSRFRNDDLRLHVAAEAHESHLPQNVNPHKLISINMGEIALPTIAPIDHVKQSVDDPVHLFWSLVDAPIGLFRGDLGHEFFELDALLPDMRDETIAKNLYAQTIRQYEIDYSDDAKTPDALRFGLTPEQARDVEQNVDEYIENDTTTPEEMRASDVEE